MENLEANILSEDMMKISSKPNGSISIPKKEYNSHILERMKLANPNRSRIIPSQGGYKLLIRLVN